MKITVIGLGYLGATHAIVMAKLGHEVIGIESSQQKVDDLKAGRIPFFEPGLEEAFKEVLSQGSIKFQSAHTESSREADIHFLCVGTPQMNDGIAANTDFLFSAVDELAPFLREDSVVVGKSTVPVGTALRLQSHLAERVTFNPHLAWNPEFLREGNALKDSISPDRLVFGVNDKHSEELLRKVYEPVLNSGVPLVVMDIPSAELVKVAANSFLATKISFINAVAEIAETAGADTLKIAEAIGFDERIGKKFLHNGIGYGGGCLPKDLRGFIARSEELGVSSMGRLLSEVDAINLGRRERVIQLAKEELGSLVGKKITILGASFKPNTNDIRDSPGIAVALAFAEAGAAVVVHDPISLDGVKTMYPSLGTEENTDVALQNAELVILATEWPAYLELDAVKLRSIVKNPTIIDGRNFLRLETFMAAGWRCLALGRNIG
jgi:UDPglucose 6-dehydrogenase